jgi:cytochrome c-type biogenesis protein CcmH/NrfG
VQVAAAVLVLLLPLARHQECVLLNGHVELRRRSRMEELCRERVRPRAADDFPTIRARMEELRRERAQVLGEARSRSVIHSRPYHRPAYTSPSMKAVSTSRA